MYAFSIQMCPESTQVLPAQLSEHKQNFLSLCHAREIQQAQWGSWALQLKKKKNHHCCFAINVIELYFV